MKGPAVLQHAGILGHWRDYPEGSVERAKALGFEVLYTFKHVKTTRQLWETEKQLVDRERPWVTLKLPSRDAFIEAVTGHRESVADAIISLQANGGDQKSKQARERQEQSNNQSNNIRLIQHGTNRAYLLARLDRDNYTTLADKVRSGELSAYAAGRAAGFKNCQPKTPLEQLHHWWRKASPEDRLTFLRQCRIESSESSESSESTESEAP